ncbi:MAG TPA: cytochrome c family protein [Verrucomicrobiae bacterium]|nr:cytochrome c family protein [Verrucomicrobiae bacterium]
MNRITIRTTWRRNALLLAALTGLGPIALAQSSSYYVGSQKCKDCHSQEYAVWEATKHAKGYADIAGRDKNQAIIKAVGGPTIMRKNTVCQQCHFTTEQADASSPPTVKSAVSCERCHGAASDWINVHNDYGGQDVKCESETPEHREQRIKNAMAKGWRNPREKVDIAFNCMSCHGLTRDSVPGDVIAKMLDAGHPLEADYELVQYSQGTVRHRFYPSAPCAKDNTVNKQMTNPELAQWYIIGQAAKLVSATGALNKTDNAKYKAAQQKRIDDAKAALGRISSSVPEAKAVLDAPSEDNARKLEAAIAKSDLYDKVKDLLPAPSTYK